MDLPWDFANAIIYSYKLALGDFDTDGFNDGGQLEIILWLIFVIATFLL